jgi:acetyltransferase
MSLQPADWQGKGLGTILLHDLLKAGRVQGIERLFRYVPPENNAMLHICRKLGFAIRHSATEDALEVEIKLRKRLRYTTSAPHAGNSARGSERALKDLR